MWSRTGKLCRRSGFTLIEALVALVVAGLLLPTLARALGAAWTGSRTAMEVVSAMVLAHDAAGGSEHASAEARDLGFVLVRSVRPVEVLVLPSNVAPAPGGTGSHDDGKDKDLDPKATPSGMKLVVPHSFETPLPGAAQAALVLRWVSIIVRTPSGRGIALDSVRFDDAAR